MRLIKTGLDLLSGRVWYDSLMRFTDTQSVSTVRRGNYRVRFADGERDITIL